MFSDIYRGKRVLVTGDSGFKGSWLVLWLQKLGAEVCGFSNLPPSKPSHAELLNLNYEKITGDICNLDTISSAVLKFKPEIIFHLAAQPLVRRSYSSPVETFQTNIMGTVNLLEAARSCSNLKAIIVVTSDKCYENREDGEPFVEDDSLGGFDPYSASKGATEIVATSYFNSFLKERGVLLSTVRAGNVIGGGDWGEDRLIPDIMRAAAEGKIVEIRSPEATRPWQSVLEPLSGYLLVGQKLLEGRSEFATSWNFGPNIDDHKSVGEIVKLAKREWPSISFEVSQSGNSLHEAKLLSLNCTKSKKELSWSPVWSGNIAIIESVRWYKSYYKDKAVISNTILDHFIDDARESDKIWVD